MEGKILDYNSNSKEGLIKSSNGDRYEFTADDYRSQAEIKIGQNVDFQPVDGNKATAIYLLKGELSGIATAAVESIGKVVNKENADKLAQSAKALVESEQVSKGTETVKNFLFKPLVLPIIGVVIFIVVVFGFLRGDGLAGSTFSGMESRGIFGETNISVKFKSDNKAELTVGTAVGDGTYEIDGNFVRLRVGGNVYRYSRNGNELQLEGGSTILRKE
ncbi:hypothetical protein Syn7502_02777 [Synechococcus sp. PCC 7502]|uniref:hypothetical protein n=1 Tax=Synechococcus sp. PCC 7502 TaxID=1173263 RepID=UPI00029FDA04|nr:hypothetical protein [Synechococcus sp. PCC 7502]AFY74715.1 hypothetical protein Syn7502_02777 [Synechococcus sp. PCC 7502]